MRILINDPTAVAYISGKVQAPFFYGYDQCVSLHRDDGTLVGGGLLCGYTGVGGSVEGHIAGASANWLSRRLLYSYFDCAYNHLRVGKIFGKVNATNTRALALDKHLGFVEEARLSGVFTHEGNPVDAILFSMTKDQCRFLNPPR